MGLIWAAVILPSGSIKEKSTSMSTAILLEAEENFMYLPGQSHTLLPFKVSSTISRLALCGRVAAVDSEESSGGRGRLTVPDITTVGARFVAAGPTAAGERSAARDVAASDLRFAVETGDCTGVLSSSESSMIKRLFVLLRMGEDARSPIDDMFVVMCVFSEKALVGVFGLFSSTGECGEVVRSAD
jgi:hypothetical protein